MIIVVEMLVHSAVSQHKIFKISFINDDENFENQKNTSPVLSATIGCENLKGRWADNVQVQNFLFEHIS